MGQLTTAFVFVWVLNILMFFSQLAIDNTFMSEPTQFYNCSGTIISQYSAGNNCQAITIPAQTISEELNLGQEQVREDTGIVFIDVFINVKTWFSGKLNYIAAFVTAPYTFFSSIPGLPAVISGTISTFWYAISVILLLGFIFGRST